MYLKSLEMNGFKSFADRTRLDFHPGVTAIVGPNGCGKSNVVDAIRWVLGETSARALRGDEMADVIFNGSEQRKPLGMAEVFLTLADCETALPLAYHEVCVGRRLYRDGKSEYLINRNPCRLRDIHDLFAGTGIGRACYSIMQQGKIDQLLSSKPEERRQVFEEAAGITRFKQQKTEALRKLEYADANLLRIADVLEEQKRQMNSLQRQAARARRYAVLWKDLRVLDTHWSHRLYLDLVRERAGVAQVLEDVRSRQRNIQEELPEAERILVQSRALLLEREGQIREALQAISTATSRIDSLRKQAAFNQERVTEWKALVTRMEAEMGTLEERLSQEKAELAAMSQEWDRRSGLLVSREESLSARLESLARLRQQVQEQDRQMQQSRQRFTEVDAQAASLRAQWEGLSAEVRARELRRLALRGELEQAKQRLAEAESARDALERQRDEAGAAREKREEEQALLEAELAASESSLQVAATGLLEITRALASEEARWEMLRQLAAAGEGLEKGTREVLRGLGQPERCGPGVLVPLISCLQVDEEAFAAVEAALGSAIQAVLVSGESEAASILRALRDRKLGLASLVIPQANLPAPSPPPGGTLGWLADRMEASGPGKSVLEHLLHGIALTPDLETALRVRQEHPGLPVVTLEGDFLAANGVISGGFRDPRSGSALRIQREIRKLGKSTRELVLERARREEQCRREDERVQAARAGTERQREAWQEAQVETARLEAQWRLAVREVEQAQAHLEQLAAEKEALDQTGERGCPRLASLEEKRQALESARARWEEERPGMEESLGQLRRLEEAAAEETAGMRTEVALERQSVESLRHLMEPLRARLQESERSLQRHRVEAARQGERIASVEKESGNLSRQAARAEKELKERRGEHGKRVSQRDEQIREVAEREAALARHRQEESRLTQEAAQGEVRLAQLDLRLENLTGQIWQRYQVELAAFSPDEQALRASIESQRTPGASPRDGGTPGGDGVPAGSPEASAGPDWGAVADCLPDLRRRVDAFGPVSLDAIAEFEELESRFQMVRAQHQDLIASRDELRRIVAKINRTTRSLFSSTFEQIAAHFRTTFGELFGRGSHAALVLLDDQEPLESGIDIIAKPPGKKLQSISLLSGGERSLTAVALLFAIYLVKPSPFCVLDELDAPLDEANIERFCRVLGRFCDQSQFVMVTHSKRTMHRADVLYGISMEEKGVSKTLSVQLTRGAEFHSSAA